MVQPTINKKVEIWKVILKISRLVLVKEKDLWPPIDLIFLIVSVVLKKNLMDFLVVIKIFRLDLVKILVTNVSIHFVFITTIVVVFFHFHHSGTGISIKKHKSLLNTLIFSVNLFV